MRWSPLKLWRPEAHRPPWNVPLDHVRCHATTQSGDRFSGFVEQQCRHKYVAVRKFAGHPNDPPLPCCLMHAKQYDKEEQRQAERDRQEAASEARRPRYVALEKLGIKFRGLGNGDVQLSLDELERLVALAFKKGSP